MKSRTSRCLAVNAGRNAMPQSPRECVLHLTIRLYGESRRISDSLRSCGFDLPVDAPKTPESTQMFQRNRNDQFLLNLEKDWTIWCAREQGPACFYPDGEIELSKRNGNRAHRMPPHPPLSPHWGERIEVRGGTAVVPLRLLCKAQWGRGASGRGFLRGANAGDGAMAGSLDRRAHPDPETPGTGTLSAEADRWLTEAWGRPQALPERAENRLTPQPEVDTFARRRAHEEYVVGGIGGYR